MTVTNNFETNGDTAILQLNHLFEVGERDKRYISTLVGHRGGGGATANPCTTGTSETEEEHHPTLSSLQPRHFNGLSYF